LSEFEPGLEGLLFIILQRYRTKPTQERVERAGRYMADLMARGLKVHGAYYTLGEYDAIFIIETPPAMDEKFLVEKLIEISDVVQTQTMVAVRQEGVSLFPEQ
jgi:uncharacterized protein with GYD domain